MRKNSTDTFSVSIDVNLSSDSVNEDELGLIRLHLGDLINKTFNTTQKES